MPRRRRPGPGRGCLGHASHPSHRLCPSRPHRCNTGRGAETIAEPVQSPAAGGVSTSEDLTSEASEAGMTSLDRQERRQRRGGRGTRRSAPLAGLLAARRRVLHDGRRPDDHQRRAADHRPQAALPRAGPAVGGDRLRADLRRVPAARRPGRRPARPPAPVHGRAGHLHRGLARLRAGHQPTRS